jgi:hypothetical protein
MKAKKRTYRKRAAIAPAETFKERLLCLSEALKVTHLAVLVAIDQFSETEHALSVFLVGEQPEEKPKRRRRKVGRKPRAKTATKRAKRAREMKTVKVVKKEKVAK